MMKPEPMIDKQGVPWCDEQCEARYQAEHAGATISCHISKKDSHVYCNIICLPVVQEMVAELERMRAVVGRLPKTADGVVVTPGMELWKEVPIGTVRRHVVLAVTVGSAVLEDCGAMRYATKRYYSTREVAEAAKGGECDERTSEVG